MMTRAMMRDMAVQRYVKAIGASLSAGGARSGHGRIHLYTTSRRAKPPSVSQQRGQLGPLARFRLAGQFRLTKSTRALASRSTARLGQKKYEEGPASTRKGEIWYELDVTRDRCLPKAGPYLSTRDGMNRRDVDHALEQFSEDVQFQDLLFSTDKHGKAELREHFETCLDGFPAGLRFVIDEVSTDAGDRMTGMYWHCETKDGKAFPFSRGLSFYKVNAAGKICFAREIPEPAAKPGPLGLAMAKVGGFLMQFVPESITFPKI